jgi:Xaa-Pro aminopeptidase
MQQRVDRLRAALAELGLPALLVGAPSNRRYLSGFSGSYGWLVVTSSASFILTDSRYRLQSANESPDFNLCEIVNPGRAMPDLVKEICGELGIDRLGFEASHMSVAEHSRVAAALGDAVELVPTEGLIEGLRALKDAAEVATLRRAIAITDEVFEAVAPRLRPDHTESEAAWMIEKEMRERGAGSASFSIIVGAGLNAAHPHHHPGDETLGEGRTIVIDMGALVDGYHADLTRTIVLGEPDSRFWEIYDIVLEAEKKAIAGIRPGILAHELDALARDHISAAGYGDCFGHGLGHGVGLDIHEGPSIRWVQPDATSQPLQAGMVTTIEPGIYIPDWGGVRIEDVVLVTENGHEVLSKAVKLR